MKTKLTKQTLINWAGPIFLLLVYGLLSLKIIDSGPIYQIMNIIGSLLIIASLWPDRSRRLPLILFNLVWISLAVISLLLYGLR